VLILLIPVTESTLEMGAAPTTSPASPVATRRRRRPRRFWGRHGWKAAVLGIAVVLIAAGIGAEIYRYEHRQTLGPVVNVTVELGHIRASSILCSGEGFPIPGEIYYEVSFDVISISAHVTTAQFGVELTNPLSTTLPSSSPAPKAESTLPCNGGSPASWYAEYTGGPYGPWATFPYGGNGWSDRAIAPANLSTQGWFDIISSADLTGTQDNFTAFGLGGSQVTFTGETMLPAWLGP